MKAALVYSGWRQMFTSLGVSVSMFFLGGKLIFVEQGDIGQRPPWPRKNNTNQKGENDQAEPSLFSFNAMRLAKNQYISCQQITENQKINFLFLILKVLYTQETRVQCLQLDALNIINKANINPLSPLTRIKTILLVTLKNSCSFV